MTLNERFPLKNSGPSCTLKMKMALRVKDQIRWFRFSDAAGPSISFSLHSLSEFQVLYPNKDSSSNSSTPSSVQVRRSSSSNPPNPTPRPSVSSLSPKPQTTSTDIPESVPVSPQDLLNRRREPGEFVKSPGSTDSGQSGAGGGGGAGGAQSLAETGRSSSNLNISGSQQYLAGGKEPTPSIASDISNPYAAQELQQRLQLLHKWVPALLSEP